MERAGLTVHKNSQTEKITKDEDTGKLTLHNKDGEAHGDFDVILMAIGEGYGTCWLLLVDDSLVCLV